MENMGRAKKFCKIMQPSGTEHSTSRWKIFRPLQYMSLLRARFVLKPSWPTAMWQCLEGALIGVYLRPTGDIYHPLAGDNYGL